MVRLCKIDRPTPRRDSTGEWGRLLGDPSPGSQGNERQVRALLRGTTYVVKIDLRRTWPEIAEYLATCPEPLRITQIANRVSPRSWSAEWSFDQRNRLLLAIDCDPPLNDREALSLIDGSVEEVFLAEVIQLRLSAGSVWLKPSEHLRNPPPTNLADLALIQSTTPRQLLYLEGFLPSAIVPPDIQKPDRVRQFLLTNTWFGSPQFIASAFEFRWTIFGATTRIEPASRYRSRLGNVLTFSKEVQLYDNARNHVGHVSLATSPSLPRSEVFTTFGPIDNQLLGLVPKDLVTSPSRWIVELGGKRLERAVREGHPTLPLVRDFILALPEAAAAVTASADFTAHNKQVERRRDVDSADRLRHRQERAQRHPKVVVGGRPIMLAPSCEMEVLALLCKLESLRALPFHEFQLLEHTAKVGIDALASYRIRDIDAPSQFATLELEYLYENFLHHEHPHHHVNLVVCWDFQDPEPPESLRYRHDWLFEYRNGDSFLVLVLSRIPGLLTE